MEQRGRRFIDVGGRLIEKNCVLVGRKYAVGRDFLKIQRKNDGDGSSSKTDK